MNSATPLTGGDRIKVVVFFLILAGTTFFGVIPLLIVLASIYIMKKDKSFSPIINSKKHIKVYLILLALLLSIFTSCYYYRDNTRSWRMEEMQEDEAQIYIAKKQTETAMVALAGLVLTPITVSLLMSLFSILYFKPLEEHQEWVVNNGIFADLKDIKNDDSTAIMGIDKLSSFSVADELIKWNDLLEKKLISQEEFNKAKRKLLNQKL